MSACWTFAFEGELSDADLLSYATHIRDKLLGNPVLEQQAKTNTKEQFALGDFRKAMMGAIISGQENYQSMAEQVLGNEGICEGFASVLLDIVYEAFRGQAETKS
jgi:type I restriction enzyme R subunit